MRTPNTACVLCEKPLYRRPSDMAKARYAACINCRSEAQKVVGVTQRQHVSLRLGRRKGTNNLAGIPKSEASKRKCSQSMRRWSADNPEKLIERGAKTRGPLNYRWNSGSSKLNDSIRRMTENRKWMDAIKARDGACTRCGSSEELESHHKDGLAVLIERLAITSRDDARRHAVVLWNIDNGETLCRRCHYAEHGRTYAD